jgi:hypothetical protein
MYQMALFQSLVFAAYFKGPAAIPAQDTGLTMRPARPVLVAADGTEIVIGSTIECFSVEAALRLRLWESFAKAPLSVSVGCNWSRTEATGVLWLL